MKQKEMSKNTSFSASDNRPQAFMLLPVFSQNIFFLELAQALEQWTVSCLCYGSFVLTCSEKADRAHICWIKAIIYSSVKAIFYCNCRPVKTQTLSILAPAPHSHIPAGRPERPSTNVLSALCTTVEVHSSLSQKCPILEEESRMWMA